MGEIRRLEIHNRKLLRQKKLLIVSDIHREKTTGQDNLDKVQAQIKPEFEEIDMILIVGDLLNDVNDLKDPEFKRVFIESIKEFTKGKPTFVTLGNHDKMTREGNEDWNEGNEQLLLEVLSEIENVRVVDESVQKIGEIRIGSFSPDNKYYLKRAEDKREFERQFHKQFEPDMFDSNTYNIFMTHEPQSIINLSEEMGEIIQPHTDLVLSGHMHNGLLPVFVSKIIKYIPLPTKIRNQIKNMGLLSPQMKIFPKYACGEHKVGETDFIINGPVNTRVECPLLNKLYGTNATVLTLKPENQRQKVK